MFFFSFWGIVIHYSKKKKALSLIEDTCHAMNISSAYINVPIIIGAQSSDLSMSLNSITSAFDILQISAASTSIALSSQKLFNRVIASDDVQARGLIELCRKYEWMEIGVLHLNSNYGIYFMSKLNEYATFYGIKLTEYSYDTNNKESMKEAIELMINSSDLLINLLICAPVDLYDIVEILQLNNRWQYPYYYIFTDSLFNSYSMDTNIININSSFSGYIGTCPWNPTYSQFIDEVYEDYKISALKYQNFSQLWKYLYDDNSTQDIFYNTNTDKPGLFSAYSYDLIYLIAYSIQRYQTTHNQNIDEYLQFDPIKLQNIIRSVEISFIGTTGNVSLNMDTGDRQNGLFGICNVDNDRYNTIKSVGFFYLSDIDNNLTFYLDEQSITWPQHFIVKLFFFRCSCV